MNDAVTKQVNELWTSYVACCTSSEYDRAEQIRDNIRALESGVPAVSDMGTALTAAERFSVQADSAEQAGDRALSRRWSRGAAREYLKAAYAAAVASLEEAERLLRLAADHFRRGLSNGLALRMRMLADKARARDFDFDTRLRLAMQVAQ